MILYAIKVACSFKKRIFMEKVEIAPTHRFLVFDHKKYFVFVLAQNEFDF